jgi:hypothetical protein
LIKKNKIVFVKNKNFDKLIAKYEKEKTINFSMKWDNAIKKVVSEDL